MSAALGGSEQKRAAIADLSAEAVDDIAAELGGDLHALDGVIDAVIPRAG